MFQIAEAFVEINAKVNKSSFLKSVSSFLTVAPAIGALTSSFGGLAAAAMSIVSSLGYSTLALAAAIPAAVGLGGAMGVLKLIFTDMAGGPMANFAKGLTGIQTQLQKTAQAAAAPGLDKMMAALQHLIPVVNEFVNRLASGIGQAGEQVAKLMDSPLFQGKLRGLLDESAKGTTLLFQALDSVLDMLVTIGVAAAPIFTRLSSNILDTVEKWQRWVNLRYQTGELQAVLKGAADEAAIWFSIVKNFATGIVNIFAQAKDSGHGLAESILRISEAFKTWTADPEVQARIKEILTFLLNVDYVRIFELAAALSAVGLALKGMIIVTSIAEGLKGLTVTLLGLGPAGLLVGAVFASLLIYVGLLAGGFVLLYTNSQDVRDLIADLARVVGEEVIPRLQEFWSWLSEQVTPALERAGREAVPIIRDALRELKTTWTENKDEIIGLMGKLQPLIEFIIREGIPAFTRFAAQGLTVYIDAVNRTIQVLALLNSTMDRVKGVVDTVGRKFEEVANWIRNSWDSLMGFIGGLPGRIAGVFGGVGDLLTSSGRAIIDSLANGIRQRAGAAVDAARSVMESVRRLFPFSPAKEGPFSGQGYTDVSGRHLAEDFASGIRSGWPAVADAALSLTQLAQHPMAQAATEFLQHLGRGGRWFEDLSFTGMSANYAHFRDQFAKSFWAQNKGRDFGGGWETNAVRDFFGGPHGVVAEVKAGGPSNQHLGTAPVEMTFAGDTDSALASAIMKLVRTGQIQLAVRG